MRALSIRQPFAEEILRGLKTLEYRSRRTSILGEKFYIYASKTLPHDDQLARFSKRYATRKALRSAKLVRGLIVGTATIKECIPPGPGGTDNEFWGWVLTDVRRLSKPFPPEGRPMPTWFIGRYPGGTPSRD